MSLPRRTLLSRLVGTGIAATGLACSLSWAQRVTNPIARPPGARLAGAAAVAGRLRAGDGVAGGTLPGLFTVVSVDTRADTMQLRDDAGNTAPVHVAPTVYDLDTLKPGDRVEVDFVAPVAGNARLEAAGVWPVAR